MPRPSRVRGSIAALVVLLAVAAGLLHAAGGSDGAAAATPSPSPTPALSATATPTPAQAGAPVLLPGHVLAALARAQSLARQPQVATQPLILTLGLNRTDQAGFDAFLQAVQDPRSPSYRHFLSQSEQADRFGPSPQAVAAVRSYMEGQGFTLVQDSANRLTLTFQGTRAQAEQAFAVQIGDYQIGSRTFFANSSDPAVPASIAPYLQAVAGLNNLARPHRAAAATTPNGHATPMDLATFYNFSGIGSATGAGQRIGLVEFSTYTRSDVTAWLNYVGLSPSLLNNVTDTAVNGGTTDSSGQIEDLLDIDVALGIAPGAAVVDYQAPNCQNGPNSCTSWQQMFNAMISDHDTVISNSWASCESDDTSANVQNIDSIFASAAGGGVAIFTASADNENTCIGAATYPNTISVPGDAPHGIAVGGTTIALGAGSSYGSERFWNQGGNPPVGSGYGVSQFFTRPAFQDGFTTSSMRSIPDVSADGDPATGIDVCQGGTCGLIGGTSLAAPVWAAGTALINQQLGGGLGGPAVLYGTCDGSSFHTAASMSSDFAHLGLGSPNMGNLYAAVAPPRAPCALTLVTPVEGSTNVSVTPTISWRAPTGAISGTTQYTAYVWDPGAGVMRFQQTTTATQIAVSPALAAGTFYYYSVQACNGTKCGPLARWEGFTTIGTPGAPGLTSPVEGSTNVSLTPTMSWTAPTNALGGTTQYTAYIWDPTAGAYAFQGTTGALSIAVPAGSALHAGRFYYYTAQACNGSACGPIARWEGFTTIGTPGAPGLVSPIEGSTGIGLTPTLQWTAPSNSLSGTTNYTGFVWDPSGSVMAFQGTTTALSIGVPPGQALQLNHFYYYSAQACNGSACGPLARWEGFTTVASVGTPGLTSPVEGSSGNGVTPTLTWTAPAGAIAGTTQYTAYVWDPTAQVMKFQQTTTALQIAVPAGAGLQAGHFYYYSVQACNGSTCGPLARWEGFTS